MANNQIYIVAEASIPGVENPLRTASLQEALSSYIGAIPGAVLKKINGSNTLSISMPHDAIDSQLNTVLDPLKARLDAFKEEQGENWGSVEINVYDLRSTMMQNLRDDEVRNLGDSVRRLQREARASEQEIASLTETGGRSKRRYVTAEATADELRAQLGGVQTELDKSKDYVFGLEHQVSLLTGNTLEVFSTPDNLMGGLQGNKQLYFQAQENMIAQVYHQVSEAIGGREFYEKFEEVNEARKTIEQRDKYLEEHGQTALEGLPQAGREATLKEWEGAENSIIEFEKYQECITALDVPIRIAKTDGGTAIVIPVNPKSKNKVARSLYNNLVAYSAELQSEFGLEVSVDDKQPFATLNITGEVDYSTIEDKLLSAFGEVAEQAKLNLQPFSFDYFESSLDKKRPLFESVNPRDYIQFRILELNYQSQAQFAREKNIKGFNDTLLRLSRGGGLSEMKIIELSTALNIERTDLEAVIKNYSSGTPQTESAPPEIESPAPEALVTAPMELLIAPPAEVIAATEGVIPGIEYLKSLVREKYGNQKNFHAETGMRMGYFIERLQNDHDIPDPSIKKIAGHFPGVRWDTIKKNIRQKR